MELVKIRVHRWGLDPTYDSRMEVVVQDRDGSLYARHGDRWWVLSRGDRGYHAFCYGIPDASMLAKRLDAFYGAVAN